MLSSSEIKPKSSCGNSEANGVPVLWSSAVSGRQPRRCPEQRRPVLTQQPGRRAKGASAVSRFVEKLSHGNSLTELAKCFFNSLQRLLPHKLVILPVFL